MFRTRSLIYGILLCTLVFFSAGTYLVRPLWFDEALTVQNFALLDSVESIYFNYVIPNNQILYTVMLHYWIKLYCGLGGIDEWMRIVAVNAFPAGRNGRKVKVDVGRKL